MQRKPRSWSATRLVFVFDHQGRSLGKGPDTRAFSHAGKPPRQGGARPKKHIAGLDSSDSPPGAIFSLSTHCVVNCLPNTKVIENARFTFSWGTRELASALSVCGRRSRWQNPSVRGPRGRADH